MTSLEFEGPSACGAVTIFNVREGETERIEKKTIKKGGRGRRGEGKVSMTVMARQKGNGKSYSKKRNCLNHQGKRKTTELR